MEDCGNRARLWSQGERDMMTFFILLRCCWVRKEITHTAWREWRTTFSERQRRQLVNWSIFRSLNTSRLPNWKQGKNRIFLNCWKFKKRAENWKWIMTEFMGLKYFCLGREGVQFWWIFTIKKWKIKKGLVIVCWSQ